MILTASMVTRELSKDTCAKLVPSWTTDVWPMSPGGYSPQPSPVPTAIRGVGAYPGVLSLTPWQHNPIPVNSAGAGGWEHSAGRFASQVGMPRPPLFDFSPPPKPSLSLPGVPRAAAMKPSVSAGTWTDKIELGEKGKPVVVGVIDPEGRVIKHGKYPVDFIYQGGADEQVLASPSGW